MFQVTVMVCRAKHEAECGRGELMHTSVPLCPSDACNPAKPIAKSGSKEIALVVLNEL